jgi:hypothetical protein
VTDADQHTGAGSAEAEAKARADAALTRLPPRLRQAVVWLLSRWPGRIAVAGARVSLRVDIFDRSSFAAVPPVGYPSVNSSAPIPVFTLDGVVIAAGTGVLVTSSAGIVVSSSSVNMTTVGPHLPGLITPIV